MQVYQALFSDSLRELLKTRHKVSIDSFDFQNTRKEFDGDVTLLVFPLLKFIKNRPDKLAEELGEYLKINFTEVYEYNVIKGFLNLSLTDSFYLKQFDILKRQENGLIFPFDKKSETVLVEFSSPNTNKPLHLGHIRNNLLGDSIARILKSTGYKVKTTQIINDRGIHICKSMIAYKLFGEGKTPDTTDIKGDKFVGNYYVIYNNVYESQLNELLRKGISKEVAEKQVPIFLEAQGLLKKWEDSDKETLKLWKKMNNWVYSGFNKTYDKLQVCFDKNYYESDTYILGKEVVRTGLEKNMFYKELDESVWIDLEREGLGKKLLLRSDNTSVYITQDLGTAIKRTEDFENLKDIIYVVGNEQEYHFKTLFSIIKKLGYNFANSLYHLSYGMVDLPKGKMKSREGTVIDADDLIEEMSDTAKNMAENLGKLDDLTQNEKDKIYQKIGMGALKYYLLKIDPKKHILFNPKESVNFKGDTGPFVQYTYVRIQSILDKVKFSSTDFKLTKLKLIDEKEKVIIKCFIDLKDVLEMASKTYNPSLIAKYTYDLVKEFNSFYQSIPILTTTSEELKSFRVELCFSVSKIIAFTFSLLGIQMPKRM